MSEELNQVQEPEEGLFDDFVEETVESTPTETEESAESVETPVVSEEPFLKIKYNKEELGLSRDEAVEFAQKGKNYDHLYEKYNGINTPLEKLARMNGMEVGDYINSLSETQINYEISRELEALKGEYPNSDESLLQDLAQRRVNERINAEEIKFQKSEQEKTDARTQEAMRQIERFNKVYPELEPDKLDNKVYQLITEGYSLLEAYTIFKNESANTPQSKVQKLNEENRKRSYGSMTNTGVDVEDDFMKGFLG